MPFCFFIEVLLLNLAADSALEFRTGREKNSERFVVLCVRIEHSPGRMRCLFIHFERPDSFLTMLISEPEGSRPRYFENNY